MRIFLRENILILKFIRSILSWYSLTTTIAILGKKHITKIVCGFNSIFENNKFVRCAYCRKQNINLFRVNIFCNPKSESQYILYFENNFALFFK